MYRDTALIKKHIVKVRMDDDLDSAIESLANFTGEQKAALLRRLIKIGLAEFHANHSAAVPNVMEGPIFGLKEA